MPIKLIPVHPENQKEGATAQNPSWLLADNVRKQESWIELQMKLKIKVANV